MLHGGESSGHLKSEIDSGLSKVDEVVCCLIVSPAKDLQTRPLRAPHPGSHQMTQKLEISNGPMTHKRRDSSFEEFIGDVIEPTETRTAIKPTISGGINRDLAGWVKLQI